MLDIKNRDAYKSIVSLMVRHGFVWHSKSGNLIRESTGCSFSHDCINKYDSIMDFQLDWPYSFD